MELIARDHPAGGSDGKEAGEIASLIGILSIVHVLLVEGPSTAIGDLSLPDAVVVARTEPAGPLARLLRFVECLDAGSFAELAETTAELGIEPSRFLSLQNVSYEWVLRMIKVDAGA